MAKKYWITDVQLGMLTAMKNENDRRIVANKITEGQSMKKAGKAGKTEDSSADDAETDDDIDTNEEMDTNTDTSGYIDHVKDEGSWGEDNQKNDYDNKYGGAESK